MNLQEKNILATNFAKDIQSFIDDGGTVFARIFNDSFNIEGIQCESIDYKNCELEILSCVIDDVSFTISNLIEIEDGGTDTPKIRFENISLELQMWIN